MSISVGTFGDGRTSHLRLACHRVPRSKVARAVRRVPIRPLLVWSVDDVKPNRPLCFCNPTVFPRLPSSDQLFLVKSLPFFAPCVSDLS